MSEPYSLRTLAAPELRGHAALSFATLALAGVALGLATAGFATGSRTQTADIVAVAFALVAIVGALYGLKEIDERAREIDSEA